MGVEIERKFLVHGDAWRALGQGTDYRQGYLLIEKDRTIRVRVGGGEAFLTIKSAAVGLQRSEFEYEIPVEDANLMLDRLCIRPLIEKTRYRIEMDDVVWEVDEFHGENEGLIIAEVELEHESQQVDLPEWIGEEVSHDHRYSNASLVKKPYNRW